MEKGKKSKHPGRDVVVPTLRKPICNSGDGGTVKYGIVPCERRRK
jgi:hypothetical protein